MRERRKPGSVRGAESNLRPYSTTYSNRKPATCSDLKPAGIPISSRPPPFPSGCNCPLQE